MFDPMSSVSDLGELVQPEPEWDVLVLSDGNFGVVQAFAAHVNRVTLVCANKIAAQEAEEAAANSSLDNIVFEIHGLESLPYGDDRFDLLFCDHSSYRVSNMEAWLLEAGRILKPRGLIALATYLVPGTRLRGKKARRQREAGDYINAWCRLRNSQHGRFYNQNRWEDLLMVAGFKIEHLETADEIFSFTQWVDEASPSDKDRLRLKGMLIQAPENAREFLTPHFSGDRIRFRLPEITILATSQKTRIDAGDAANSVEDSRQID